jgi:hypothetical protein
VTEDRRCQLLKAVDVVECNEGGSAGYESLAASMSLSLEIRAATCNALIVDGSTQAGEMRPRRYRTPLPENL